MAVERLELPDGQWADIERRPTHGTIRRIGKETDRLGRTDPLAGEDVIIGNLVKDWHIMDEKGDSVPFKREDFDRIPQDVFSQISDECLTIVESAYPNQRAAR
jgi:hypothetical protein